MFLIWKLSQVNWNIGRYKWLVLKRGRFVLIEYERVKMTSVKTKGSMKMDQIKRKASKLGIKPGKMSKTDLIRTIQQAEGFTPCFGTTNGQCWQSDCCFMQDCLKTNLRITGR